MNYREGSKVTLIIPAAHGEPVGLVNGTVDKCWPTGKLDVRLEGDSEYDLVQIHERHVMEGWLA